MYTFRDTRGLPTILCESFFTSLEIVSEPSNKGVAQATDEIARMVTARLSRIRNGFASLKVLKEILVSVPQMLGFKPFSPLFETFNDMTGQFSSVGFFTELFGWMNYSSDGRFGDVGPQVLTMDHIGLCFIICSIPLALGFVVFLIENVVHFCKKITNISLIRGR